MNVTTAAKPMARREMAKRLADDIPEGWYVNLGIGAPLQVADYVPQEREVVFQSENGILGMGPAPEPDKINRWLINAGKQYITLRSGGSYMHHADSFALIRGGHLDIANCKTFTQKLYRRMIETNCNGNPPFTRFADKYLARFSDAIRISARRSAGP